MWHYWNQEQLFTLMIKPDKAWWNKCKRNQPNHMILLLFQTKKVRSFTYFDLWVYIFWHNHLSIKCGVYQSRWQTKSIGSVRMAEFPSNHSESSWKRWDKYNRVGKLTVEQSWWLPYMQICLILNKSPKIHSYLIYYKQHNKVVHYTVKFIL